MNSGASDEVPLDELHEPALFSDWDLDGGDVAALGERLPEIVLADIRIEPSNKDLEQETFICRERP